MPHRLAPTPPPQRRQHSQSTYLRLFNKGRDIPGPRIPHPLRGTFRGRARHHSWGSSYDGRMIEQRKSSAFRARRRHRTHRLTRRPFTPTPRRQRMQFPTHIDRPILGSYPRQARHEPAHGLFNGLEIPTPRLAFSSRWASKTPPISRRRRFPSLFRHLARPQVPLRQLHPASANTRSANLVKAKIYQFSPREKK